MLYSSVAVLALGLFGCTGFRFRVPPPIKFDFFPICCALLLFLFVLLVCYSVFVCVCSSWKSRSEALNASIASQKLLSRTYRVKHQIPLRSEGATSTVFLRRRARKELLGMHPWLGLPTEQHATTVIPGCAFN